MEENLKKEEEISGAAETASEERKPDFESYKNLSLEELENRKRKIRREFEAIAEAQHLVATENFSSSVDAAFNYACVLKRDPRVFESRYRLSPELKAKVENLVNHLQHLLENNSEPTKKASKASRTPSDDTATIKEAVDYLIQIDANKAAKAVSRGDIEKGINKKFSNYVWNTKKEKFLKKTGKSKRDTRWFTKLSSSENVDC